MEIPKQIENFNFVLIGEEKKPFEKKWQELIHRKDDIVFQKHLAKGGNYGVQSNNSSIIVNGKSCFLVIIDFDKREFQDKVISFFPETFTTTSGSPKKCWHLWFASDNNKAFKVKDEKVDVLVDVLGAGNQVIAPGSKHKSGSTYSIVKDLPIAFMPYAEIEAILKPYDKTPKKPEKEKKQYVPKGMKGDISSRILNSVSMKQILEELGINTSQNPTGCYFHSSVGGKCLGWNDETCHCFHCEKSWNKFSLIREAKNLSDKATFEWFADKAGLVDELKDSRREYAEKNKNYEVKEEEYDTSKSIKEQYIDLLKDKKWGDASELLANWLEKILKLYTTKDDIKSEMWVYKEGIYVPQGKSEIKELLRRCLGKWYSMWMFNQVIAKIEADTYIDANKLFSNNYVYEVPVQNGILNILTRELKPFNPNQIFFNKLPVIYNPEAEPFMIDQFLSQILADEQDKQVFYEIGGFALLKEYMFEKSFMFVGNGRNGKGKCLELIKRVIGTENCYHLALSTLKADNADVHQLFGKMINMAGDISNTDLKDTGLFKALTGRDPVTIRRKFLNSITFTNYAKFVFACNDLPIVYDMSKGFWDRWVLIEFPYYFADKTEYESISQEERIKLKWKLRDEEIVNKIATQEELSGLLNAFLDGLDRLLKARKFSTSKGTEEIKNTWIRKSNSFMAFAMDFLEDDYNVKISKKELRKRYSGYCKKHQINCKSDFIVKRVLNENFGVSEEREYQTGEWFWVGIKWKGSFT